MHVYRLWGVENSGDDLNRTINGTTYDIHKDNPADELNFLGDVTQSNDIWYGYPTCFTVWNPDEIIDRHFRTGQQFVQSPNQTFNDNSCKGTSAPPQLNFQAHSAPLDCKFDVGFKNLYVSFHGSHDRDPPTGYKIVEIPFTRSFDGSYKPVARSDSIEGYTDVLFPPDETLCNVTLTTTTCVRPVGLVFDSHGRLYMTSDTSHEVFLLQKS